MKYDFDEIIDRNNTGSIKYDWRDKLFGDNDVIPMWVADMDFKTPDFVIEAVKKRADHPVYGYTFHTESFYNSIKQWMLRKHSWNIDESWICFSPGIVPALNMCVMAYTDPGDKIIVQPPVYFPFFSAIKDNGRVITENPLILSDGRYTMDFDDLESKIDKQTKMILLCNPHNPGGMVWTRDELSRLCEICVKHDIIILSDEIHSDLVFEPNKHIPTATLSKEISQLTVCGIAPSKTFNLAGMSSSALIIPDNVLRLKYKKALEKMHLNLGNIFGTVALEAAFTEGDDWLEQLLAYLKGNIDLVDSFCRVHMPKIKVMIPEATYMIWLDFSAYGDDKKITDLLIKRAGLGLSAGTLFGTGGNRYQRMNIACPRSVLQKALEKMRGVFV